MNKNKNYMKIYCSAAMIYALGAFGGRLHAVPFWQKYVPQFMTGQQMNQGIASLKNGAAAIMSKNYTIPQVYVWGGAIAFAGLAYLYGRQCVSLHENLFSRKASDCSSVKKKQGKNRSTVSGEDEQVIFGDEKMEGQIHEIIKNHPRLSHANFMKIYSQATGLLSRFKILALHEDIEKSGSSVDVYDQLVVNLSSKNDDMGKNVQELKEELIDCYKRLARLNGLLDDVVFSTLRALEKIRR